ncbi:hypothetical protein GCM10023210_13070 [Chryseobacterium ginsengisoli]|uniref:Uncharacterized protein n=1 Tax=Chryseobacterium ginsengisoli TaxID=363853 RepID=A0ABP9M448_9FLAO
MGVNKKFLEEKTNQELEEYIKPESKFVQEANQYAYEILKSRGRTFTDEETERFSNKENHEYNKIIHPNYKKSSEILYISVFLGIGNLIWKYDTLDSRLKIFISLIVLAFGFALAYYTSKGIEWFKYVLLVLFGFGLLSIPFIISDIKNDPVIGIINIIQTVLQVWALVLLFKIPKTVNSVNSNV